MLSISSRVNSSFILVIAIPGLAAIRAYELKISRTVLKALQEIPGLHVHGLSDPDRLEERVPTFSFTLRGWHPRKLAEKLAEQNIYVWDGNYYALAVTERLGLEDQGGMLRVGPVHYNTVEEVEQLKKALKKIAKE